MNLPRPPEPWPQPPKPAAVVNPGGGKVPANAQLLVKSLIECASTRGVSSRIDQLERLSRYQIEMAPGDPPPTGSPLSWFKVVMRVDDILHFEAESREQTKAPKAKVTFLGALRLVVGTAVVLAAVVSSVACLLKLVVILIDWIIP
jgi:hypothetical protein